MLGFTDWCIQDLDGCINVDQGRVNWYRADRTAVRYIGKQFDVSGDFFHSFAVCFLQGEVEDEHNRGFIRLWEVRNNWENRTWNYARKNDSGWTIYFEQLCKKDKVFAFQGSSQLHFDNRYTVKVSRVGDKYRLVVEDHTGLMLEDSGEIVGDDQSYGWVWLASTIKSRRNNGNWSSGYIENLIIA